MGDTYANPYRRSSGSYNDPAIGEGFDSLAKMFAPVSPQQALIAAKTAAERAKVRGLDDFYNYGQDPNASPATLDKAGVVAGLYAPTQGYGARDMHDVTTRRGQDIHSVDTQRGQDVTASTARRGQDITSGDHRYNTDSVATTSVGNNVRDNRTKTDVAMLQPVQKDATRFVPPDIADMYKTDKLQTGVIAAQPGEKNYLPDGRVLEGGVKPKTEAEVKGGIISDMSPEEQRAIGFGTTPVETVVGPTGKPEPRTRPQMLADGTTPVVKGNGEYFNYASPDGKSGVAIHDPVSNQPIDAQTRQPLAAGTKLQAPSGVQGKDPLGATTANQTEANRKNAGLNEMDLALNSYEELLKKNPGIIGIPGAVRGGAQNAVSAAQEFGAAFGNVSPEAKVTADQIAAVASKVSAGRDPAIAQARVAQADLAYKWAQMQNPSGEVSRQAFERALETIAGGALANNQSALESLGAIRETVKRARVGVSSLREPGAPGPAAAPGAATTPGGSRSFQTSSGTFTVTPVE